MMLGFCKSMLMEPGTAGLDLDSADATAAHATVIRRKASLNRIYRDYYRQFIEVSSRAPRGGARVEIGSGAGFLDEMIPGLITLDLRPGARVDVVASATDLPFANSTVSAVFMLNVLHHIRRPGRFLEELARVLVPGGRCALIEPYVSPLSRVVYRRLHHEPFDPEQRGWDLEEGGAMTSANDALPWIIMVRDRGIFNARFPALEVERLVPHTVVSYLLSGGLSYRSLLPGRAIDVVLTAEKKLAVAADLLASMMTVELVRV